MMVAASISLDTEETDVEIHYEQPVLLASIVVRLL
jgi:hypothetical protein